MASTITRREPVRIHFRDGELVVTPKDQDIFFISAEKAIEACRNVIKQEERVAKFTEELISPLVNWCEDHKEQISGCFVLIPDSAVLPVFIVGANERYDFKLTEQLSELAFRFEQHGWSVHASQIPRCDDSEHLCAYFSPERALQVYG